MTRMVLPCPGHVSAIGKLLGEPEFIRADTEALASFEAWLDESFEEAFERWGHDWRVTFREGRSYSFLWWPPGELEDADPFCGVIAPSRDSVGRDYPFAVLAQVPRRIIALAPHAVPLAIGAFLSAAYDLVGKARSRPVSRTELASALRSMPSPREVDVTRGRDVYTHWCETVPAAEAWASIAHDECAPEEIAMEAVARKNEESLRLPLGARGQHAAALWLDVRARTTGAAAQSSFWSIGDRLLFVTRGSAPRTLLGALWAEVANTDEPRPSPMCSPGERIVAEADRMALFLETLGPIPTLGSDHR